MPTRRKSFPAALIAGALLAGFWLSGQAQAQIFVFDRETLVKYTPKNPFERFPDGRPKVPDSMLERARGLSAEEIFAVLPGKGYVNQYEDGWHILHPGKKLVGRAVTAQFMPTRPEIADVIAADAKARGLRRLSHQTVIDMLEPGDVLVIDLFGKKEQGTVVGDNLFYYIMKATQSAGLVVDGSIRDLEGVAAMDMPAYFRHAHPTAIGNVMLTGVNVPVRIGKATVMPGDVVFGDREGLYFVPPHLLEEVLDRAEVTHIHDEWTKMKFDEGKYKSSEIYGSPSDPELKKEYQEYLKKRLAEIKAKQ